MDNKLSFLTLRIGLGITFLWIGILILKDPVGWGAMAAPKIQNLLPISIKTIMINTAVLDIVIGIFLINNFFPFLIWLAASIGTLHLTMVLIITGIDAITVRDIGLLGGTAAISIKTWPEKFYPYTKIPSKPHVSFPPVSPKREHE